MKKGSRHKCTIYEHKSEKNEKYLSVGNFEILSVVVDVLCLKKKYNKNERHLYLLEHISTKLPLNVCLINKHIMECPLILLLLWVFSYIIDEHYSCLKYCIFTKHSQIACLINENISVCQHIKYACRLWKILWFDCVFWEFTYITTCSTHFITSSNFNSM